LQTSAKGARVTFADGTPSVSHGPFGAPHTLLAGYCAIQVPSLQEAIAWVKRWPTLDGDGKVEIEIRQLFEADNFDVETNQSPRAA
jgi:hypothetical protein